MRHPRIYFKGRILVDECHVPIKCKQPTFLVVRLEFDFLQGTKLGDVGQLKHVGFAALKFVLIGGRFQKRFGAAVTWAKCRTRSGVSVLNN